MKEDTPTIDGRKVRFVATEKQVDTDAVARILARHITGGDYDGYVKRAMVEGNASEANPT